MYEIKSLSIVCLFSDILHSTSLSVPHTHHLLQQVHTNFCPEGKRDAAFTSDYCKKINFKSWKKIAVHVFSVEHNRMNKISFRKVCEWCGWMVLAPLMTCADLPAGLRGGQWGCLPLVYEGSWLMNMAPCQCQVREGGGESSESGRMRKVAGDRGECWGPMTDGAIALLHEWEDNMCDSVSHWKYYRNISLKLRSGQRVLMGRFATAGRVIDVLLPLLRKRN